MKSQSEYLERLSESRDRLGKQIEAAISFMGAHLQPDRNKTLVLNEQQYRRLIDILTGTST
jgi:hypothetical protein